MRRHQWLPVLTLALSIVAMIGLGMLRSYSVGAEQSVTVYKTPQ
jgi:hypothetical protein